MKHMHEWGSLALKHTEVSHRHGKLILRGKPMHLVGDDAKNVTYRPCDPERPQEVTSSEDLSFCEKSTRDVGRPKVGYDSFPDPSTLFVPSVQRDIEAEEIKQQESAEKSIVSPAQQSLLRESNRQQGISPDAQQWPLIANVDQIVHASYEQAEYLGSIGAGKPREIRHMPPNPQTYDDAVSGVHNERWRASMAEKRTFLTEHYVFEFVDPPQDIQAIPSSFLYRWKYHQDGRPCRQKPRVVVQGPYELDTGADKEAPEESQESVHLLIANAANQKRLYS